MAGVDVRGKASVLRATIRVHVSYSSSVLSKRCKHAWDALLGIIQVPGGPRSHDHRARNDPVHFLPANMVGEVGIRDAVGRVV